ncbi:hypothetical protein ABZ499_10175 [Streptomyces sp. NPDC019990]|uniref:hypothetical protein n=1 Tax=Streptomyces sp. NPDC019990 TaxID=3154693 RepID=UPI0033DCE79A
MAALSKDPAPADGRQVKPQHPYPHKTYDIPRLRTGGRDKRIGVRIAREGIDSSERPGRPM